MLFFVLLFMVLIGAVLCFAGYRFLRLSMGLCGFLLGIFIGHSIFILNGSYWNSKPAFWSYILVIVIGIVLAALSFKLYKAALFYATSLFMAILFLRLYLSVSESGNLITTFLISLFDRTAIGGAVSMVTDATVPGSDRVGEVISNSMTQIWGENHNAWFILGVCVAAGALAGFLVVLFQKPAIIILTGIFGSYILILSVFSFIQRKDIGDMDVFSFIEISFGKNGAGINIVIMLLLAALGIIFQIRKTKNLGDKYV